MQPTHPPSNDELYITRTLADPWILQNAESIILAFAWGYLLPRSAELLSQSKSSKASKCLWKGLLKYSKERWANVLYLHNMEA